MSESEQPLQTALHSRHQALEAKMSDEDGWAVPLSYAGVLDECRAVTSRAGAADLSHLGRLRIRGDGALELLERVCTADVVHQEDDTVLFTLLCNERGGIVDAVRLVRLADAWLLITGAANRGKVLEHLAGLADAMDARVDDQTLKTSQLAVAGPAAADILDAVLPVKPSDMADGGVKVGSLMIARYVAMRTRPGGQWGLEVIVPNMVAGMAWDFITKKVGANAVSPVGMAAWDVLRIEAGEVRYGCEINETIDPITAGLGWAVDLGHDFIGAEALRKISGKGAARRRVGLVIEADGDGEHPRIPRQGTAVLRADGGEFGAITSGTYSPALDKVIAMAYVAGDAATDADVVLADGDERRAARIVELPFRRPGCCA